MISTRPASTTKKTPTRTAVAPTRPTSCRQSQAPGRSSTPTPSKPVLYVRPMVPPSPRDLDIYRLRYLEQYSIRLLADRFSLSPTRIRQLLYRVQVWLTLVLPASDDPTLAQLAHLAQHLVAGQLQYQIDGLADLWEATHDLRCLRLQSQLLMMLAKLGVPPGTLEGVMAEASEAPDLFGLARDGEAPTDAPHSEPKAAAKAPRTAQDSTPAKAAKPSESPQDTAPTTAAESPFAPQETAPTNAAASPLVPQEAATPPVARPADAEPAPSGPCPPPLAVEEPIAATPMAQAPAAASFARPSGRTTARPPGRTARRTPRKRTARRTTIHRRLRQGAKTPKNAAAPRPRESYEPSPGASGASRPATASPCAEALVTGHSVRLPNSGLARVKAEGRQ